MKKISYRRVLWLGQAGLCSFDRLFFEQIRHPSVDPVRRCVASDPTLSSFGSGAVRVLKCFSSGIWRARHYRQRLFSRTRQDSVVYAFVVIYPFQDMVLTPNLSGDGIVAMAGAGIEDQVRMILFR